MNKKITPKSEKPVVTTVNHFSGPIPPPIVLAEYNKLIPNAAERILKMAEKNSDHNINIEQKKLNAAKNQITRGQIFALIVVILFVGLAGLALLLGYPFTATIIAGINFVTLITAFIWKTPGTHKKK